MKVCTSQYVHVTNCISKDHRSMQGSHHQVSIRHSFSLVWGDRIGSTKKQSNMGWSLVLGGCWLITKRNKQQKLVSLVEGMLEYCINLVETNDGQKIERRKYILALDGRELRTVHTQQTINGRNCKRLGCKRRHNAQPGMIVCVGGAFNPSFLVAFFCIGQIIKLYKTLKEFCPRSTPPQRLPGVGSADSTLPFHCTVNVFIGWSTDPVYHPTVVFPCRWSCSSVG